MPAVLQGTYIYRQRERERERMYACVFFMVIYNEAQNDFKQQPPCYGPYALCWSLSKVIWSKLSGMPKGHGSYIRILAGAIVEPPV